MVQRYDILFIPTIPRVWDFIYHKYGMLLYGA
ncbi:hypothetical protein SAMN05216354_0654 [Xylanibacter ruminicola]|uniref:Uncharacterized protein n=1 Tax=Xylanibacter ruminicola TaxID=839 RepID=A0A1H5SF27_XYLRU|nr:hypothetical protein SAMN05216354_0654 [Xylanibacter ruminicola]